MNQMKMLNQKMNKLILDQVNIRHMIPHLELYINSLDISFLGQMWKDLQQVQKIVDLAQVNTK